MNRLSLEQGRIKQKLQTRTLILKSAKSLMKRKKKISLEDIAKKAGVSRATIYRYYPNVDLLIREASLDISHSTPEDIYASINHLSLREQIFAVQDHFNQLAIEHEVEFRRYLSQATIESINSKKKLRGARRVKTLNLVLGPHSKSFKRGERAKFTSAATLLMGIDALIVCKDVALLDNESSKSTLKWSLKYLMDRVLL